MEPEVIQRIKLLFGEMSLHRRLIVAFFVIISLAATCVGINWPKIYTSSTSIYVEYKNIIDPLMAGTAVRADVTDVSANAREILYGRSILLQVLKQGGWLTANLSPQDQEQLIAALKQRTSISNVGKNLNLIRIEYQDQDPERAFAITKILGDLLIQEMLAGKTRESQAAFEFIDGEVKRYEKVLSGIQDQIKQLRKENFDAAPGSSDQVKQYINNLLTRIDTIEQEVRDAEIIRKSLQEQLSGEAEVYSTLSRAERNKARIAELQAELATLRLSYKETYPDVIQIKQQIADLQETINQEGQHSGVARDEANYYMVDQSGKGGNLYQNLKQRLYEVSTQIRTLQARAVEAKLKLAHEQERLKRIEETEATYDSLTRDYRVSEAIYQDLLQRRENARVSLNLDAEQGRLTVRITEPAFRPHQPNGPRLVDFALGGVALGAALPIALLFGVLMIDPRIRMPSAITHELQLPMLEAMPLPMLEVIPHLTSPRERRKKFRGIFWSGLVVTLTLAIIISVLWLRQQGRI